METITACENVCRDFSWFWSLLSFVPAVAPIAGVIWAVYAFFDRRKDERVAAAREKRVLLYSEMLAHLSADPSKNRSFNARKYFDYFERLNALNMQLKILAPQKVIDAFDEVFKFSALKSVLHSMNEFEFVARDDEEIEEAVIRMLDEAEKHPNRLPELVEAKEQLMAAMREDSLSTKDPFN